MRRALLDELNRLRAEGRPVVLVTRLESGEQTLLRPDTPGSGLLLDAARTALRADKAVTLETERGEVFLQPHNPALRLVVVGAVHIAQPLTAMARLAGYRVSVVDPRSAFARAARFPEVDISDEWPDEALQRMKLDARCAVVTLTHDPKLDDPALMAALRSDAFYVGALGSKKTHQRRLERLSAEGLSPEALHRIHGPVGLAIGAKSPAEIAISIMAELTQALRISVTGER